MKKIFSLFIVGTILISCGNVEICAKTVSSVVNHSRKVYYNINKNLKCFKKNQIKGEYIDYWKNKKLVKAVTFPTSTSDCYMKKYTVEYYYDSRNCLVFAFAYRKVNGKLKEHRAYYGADGKMYRYIDASGRIYNYRKGKKVKNSYSSLKAGLYNKGVYYWNLAME